MIDIYKWGSMRFIHIFDVYYDKIYQLEIDKYKALHESRELRLIPIEENTPYNFQIEQAHSLVLHISEQQTAIFFAVFSAYMYEIIRKALNDIRSLIKSHDKIVRVCFKIEINKNIILDFQITNDFSADEFNFMTSLIPDFFRSYAMPLEKLGKPKYILQFNPEKQQWDFIEKVNLTGQNL